MWLLLQKEEHGMVAHPGTSALERLRQRGCGEFQGQPGLHSELQVVDKHSPKQIDVQTVSDETAILSSHSLCSENCLRLSELWVE